MNKYLRILCIFTMLGFFSLAFPGPAYAAGFESTPIDDKVVIGDNYTLSSGETLDGSLFLVGGNIIIEEDSRVMGDVVLVGGSINIDGTIEENVTVIGGSVLLGSSAVIQGDVSTLGSSMLRSPTAQIEGEVTTGRIPSIRVPGPVQMDWPRMQIDRPVFPFDFTPWWDFSGFLARTLGLAALAMVVVLIAPNPSRRAAHAVSTQPILAGGLGLLTVVVAVPVLVVTAITLIFLPVSLVGLLILVVAVIFGWIALGLEIGKRTAMLFKAEWSLAVSAGIGIVVLSLLLELLHIIPCIGWFGLGPILVGLVGLGAVVATRFGTRYYPTPSGGPLPPTPYSAPPTSPAAVVSVPTAGPTVQVYPAPETPPEDQ